MRRRARRRAPELRAFLLRSRGAQAMLPVRMMRRPAQRTARRVSPRGRVVYGSSRRSTAVRGSGAMDILEQIFEKQRELNRFTFERNRLPEFDSIARDRRLQNEWVRNYALAMTQEVAELVDSTNWKWWRTNVDLFDEQNLKVELVDILHFWVSACQVMGLTPDDVHRMYMQKNAINARRQETGYITKDDGDNRSIG
jgi:dimeric dUTPase (all-alpha-NTP-PPase superfamily)